MSGWTPNSNQVLQTRQGFVVTQLREAILRGYFKPGQKLDQHVIANLLNVSRSPVREALRTLTAEGLVQTVPHRGSIVAQLSLAELEEICLLRGMVESMAARLAVPKLDGEQIAKLKVMLAELNATTDLDRWIDLNNQFHYTIYQAANLPRFLALIRRLRNTMAPYLREYITTSDHMEAARLGHKRIFEACASQDPELAEEETRKQLERSKKHLQAVYDK
jgi:DNA-binding GntR family transcriptional regulator